jgi:ABC-2 type transport system ATP-binding protein
VRNVTFRLEPGEITGLLGPNGAGKTTTIRMLTGYLAPTAGKVLIGGIDMANDPASARARLGYLPESTPLYPEMQVEQYILYRAALAGMRRQEARMAVGREIERCLLAGVRSQRVGTLSKGFKQRVGLAGALVHDPEVVILDEPGNGLDPSQIVQFRSVVADLAHRRTMLVSSHILAEVERICSRVLVIAGGELLADKPLSALAGPSGKIIAGCSAEHGELLFQALTGKGWSKQVITGEPGEVLCLVSGAGVSRATVAEAARHSGVTLLELREDRPTLERAFMEIIEQAGHNRPASRGVA